MRYLFLLLGLTLLLPSCKAKPKQVYIDYDATTEESDSSAYEMGSIVSSFDIPFREEGGVKLVPVEINGMKLDMIFDTGCSTTSISLAEAKYLAEKGLLSREDFLDIGEFEVADGRIVNKMIINLKKVVLGDQLVFYNIQASVSENLQAPLLLGNEVLNRVASYTIDNTEQVIHVYRN